MSDTLKTRPYDDKFIDRGFTLLEIMVVLALLSIVVSLVVIALPDRKQTMLRDAAEKFAVLLDLARAESAARAKPLKVEIDQQGYRFFIIDRGQQILLQTAPFEEQRWPWELNADFFINSRLSAVVQFRGEPIDDPHTLLMRLSNYELKLISDGASAFTLTAVTPTH